MNKNFFKFSFLNYFIRFGIIELLLIIGNFFIFPILSIILLFVFLFHLLHCRNQSVTLDPFQIEQYYHEEGGIGDERYSKKGNKYYYINEMTDFKVGFIFITLYGNIDYRKKENVNGCYEEKTKKVDKVRVYRTLENEKELLNSLNGKKQN